MLIYILIFILGAVGGSFLNSVIYRLERQQQGERITVLRGRSICPKCGHTLGFFDLFPILSFILRHGKCRYCGKRISWQYPIVEIATGALFLISYFLFLNHFLFLIFYLIIIPFLIVIFVYDLKHYVIPDKIIYPAIATAFLYQLFEGFVIGHWELFGNWKLVIGHLMGPFLAALVASGFFFLLWAVSRGKWLGFGDVKLAFLMGLLLGWPSILIGLLLSFLIGAIIGLGLILAGKKGLKSQVPFGPFLVLGTFIALFWGWQLLNWYLQFVGI